MSTFTLWILLTISTGTYNAPQTVTITSATSGATIWYTTDGTTPVNGTSSSATNGSAFTVSGTVTLKALAAKATFVDSTVTSATYTFVALPPTFSPPAGEYGSPQTVTVSDASPGVTIRYTTDGSTPTAATTTTTSSGGTLSVGATTTLKALATLCQFTACSGSPSANNSISRGKGSLGRGKGFDFARFVCNDTLSMAVSPRSQAACKSTLGEIR